MKSSTNRPTYIKHKLANTINITKIVTMHYFEFDKNFHFPGESHDFWEMVYGDELHKMSWSMKNRSEGLSNLNLIRHNAIEKISHDMRKARCDFAYMNLYLFIWVIRTHKRVSYVA